MISHAEDALHHQVKRIENNHVPLASFGEASEHGEKPFRNELSELRYLYKVLTCRLAQVAKQVLLLDEGHRADVRIVERLDCAKVCISDLLHSGEDLLRGPYIRVLDPLEFDRAQGRQHSLMIGLIAAISHSY